MKALTLKQLAKAINDLTTRKLAVFTPHQLVELQRAGAYMLGEIKSEPRDPREVLTEIGYKW